MGIVRPLFQEARDVHVTYLFRNRFHIRAVSPVVWNFRVKVSGIEDYGDLKTDQILESARLRRMEGSEMANARRDVFYHYVGR